MASANVTKRSSLWWMDAAGIGVCLLVSAVGYMALVNPLLQRRSAAAGLAGEIETRQKKIAELEKAVEMTTDRVTAARHQLETGAIQLESATHVNRRIAGVTEFFSTCALHVDDVRTNRVSSEPQYDLVPITIIGRGLYPQCTKLLHGLCSKYPDMSVMRLDLTGTPSELAEQEKFRFELFWYAAPSGSGSKTAGGTADSSPVSQS